MNSSDNFVCCLMKLKIRTYLCFSEIKTTIHLTEFSSIHFDGKYENKMISALGF